MKKIIFSWFCFLSIALFAQQQNITYSVSPTSFEENQSITITVQGSSVNEATWGITGNALYIWSWSFDTNNANSMDCPTNGTWTSSNEANKLTYNSGSDTYTITLTPTTFYSRTGIGRMGFLIKAKDGSGDKKSQDIFLNVGLFALNLTSPVENSATIINQGGNLSIAANNSNGNALYELFANGILLNSANNVSTYSYSHTNITSNQNYELKVTQGTTTKIKKFTVIVNPNTVSQAIPSGLEDGINYNSSDPTRVTLKLNAPGKDFVYVAGSFNNYQPTAAYAMKKDPSTGIFWLELTGLISGQVYTYQYWVIDQTPATNSPTLVKAADMYSYQVLSPYDDPYIPATSYPSLPTYPSGQEREVSVIQTNQTAYNWVVPSFTKPNKDNLVVYEVLVRDFDANRTYQDLINKIDYFKNLKVNAIQLMPVMEYEGNESWGYNTVFHLALDKFYGPENKLKQFIDLCHQNNIAVIFDVALNHAFGRNSGVRMWMNDSDGDGWGEPSSDNPYFNQVATHGYSVGNDFNHSSALTKYYVKRVIKRWIEDFKIDGFRWDLTKGFTQNCAGSDACTNTYQQDRVDVLKEYADYAWSLDPNHIAIFEHLGSDNEEQQWANYRLSEGKGVLMWGEMTHAYRELAMGYSANTDVTRVGHVAHGFSGKRVIGYPESHDKERILYDAFTYGNGGGAFPIAGNLNNTIKRMGAIGSISILVPGPKMIWHFGSLANTMSLYTCADGTVNTETDPATGNCKLDTKPQQQWTGDWLNVAQRRAVYDAWAKMIEFKKTLPVFNGNYAFSGTNGTNNDVRQRLYIYDDTLPTTSLKNVVVLTNFSVSNLNVRADFPYTGTWYNLMDNTTLTVTDTAMNIAIESGGFRIYGNQASNLGTEDITYSDENIQLKVVENPVVNNVIRVDYNVPNATKVEFFVFTAEGRFLFSQKTTANNGRIELPARYESGVYMIQMISDKGNGTTRAVLK